MLACRACAWLCYKCEDKLLLLGLRFSVRYCYDAYWTCVQILVKVFRFGHFSYCIHWFLVLGDSLWQANGNDGVPIAKLPGQLCVCVCVCVCVVKYASVSTCACEYVEGRRRTVTQEKRKYLKCSIIILMLSLSRRWQRVQRSHWPMNWTDTHWKY